MPLVRRSSVVAMKFSDPSSEAMQKTKIEIPRGLPESLAGTGILADGAQRSISVQPAIGGPSGTKNAAIKMQNAMNVVQNDIMLKRGKAMSSAPIWIGRK